MTKNAYVAHLSNYANRAQIKPDIGDMIAIAEEYPYLRFGTVMDVIADSQLAYVPKLNIRLDGELYQKAIPLAECYLIMKVDHFTEDDSDYCNVNLYKDKNDAVLIKTEAGYRPVPLKELFDSSVTRPSRFPLVYFACITSGMRYKSGEYPELDDVVQNEDGEASVIVSMDRIANYLVCANLFKGLIREVPEKLTLLSREHKKEE